MLVVSCGAHLVTIAVMMMGSGSWLGSQENDDINVVMSIRLGGPDGPGEGGLTPLGGRPIQQILPLEEEDQALKDEGDLQLEPLKAQIALFGAGQYARVIPQLWRKRENDPDNQDLDRLLVDSYYNLALGDLQRGRTREAAEKLKGALEIQPDNQELQRLRLFAQTYVQRPRDLLYRIFVKYLPSR